MHQKDTGTISVHCCEVKASDASPGTGRVVDCHLGNAARGGHATTEPELGAMQVLLNEGVKVGRGGC